MRTFKVDVCLTGLGSLRSYVLNKIDPHIYVNAGSRKEAESKAIEIVLKEIRPKLYVHLTETTP